MPKRRYDLIWDFSDIQAQQQMERLLDHLAGSKPPAVQFYPGAWQPAVDVYETASEIVVTAELAGVRGGDVQILISRNSLIIRGERSEPAKDDGCYHQMEISTGPFERALLLPSNVNPESATAACRDGLLEIVLPKQRNVVTRQVTIRVISRSEPE